MLFYMSLLSKQRQLDFYEWMLAVFDKQTQEFTTRFQPVVDGLGGILLGDANMDYRFLGWSCGTHPLMPK